MYCPIGNQCNYEEVNSLLNSTRRSAIVGGDWNAHSDLWEDGGHTNASGRAIYQYLQMENKYLLLTPENLGTRPNYRNHQSSTIDLTLITPDLIGSSTIVTGPYWGSDHLPIIFTIGLNALPNSPSRCNWKFEDSNWIQWNYEMEKPMKKTSLIGIHPENAYNSLYAAIMRASNKHFAVHKHASPRILEKAWWSEDCRKAVRDAKRAHHVWRSTLLPVDKAILNRLEAVKKWTILSTKNKSWEHYINNLDQGNSAKFWKFATNMINGKPEYNPAPLKKNDGEHTSDPVEKASIFLEQFSPSDDTNPPAYLEFKELIRNSLLDQSQSTLDMDFNSQEFSTSLLHLQDKAIGIDRIHNKMLKS